MQFGRVMNIESVDLNLPFDDSRNKSRLEALDHSDKVAQVFYGCPVWSQKAWVGDFYPAKAKSTELLQIYSRQVNAIEFNSSFYGIPEEETVKKWMEQCPPDFKFCPKFPQSISHTKTLAGKPEIVARFAQVLQSFENHLGLSFFQLPETTTVNDVDYLSDLFTLLPKGLPVAVEFRHPSWFSDGKLGQHALELMNAYKLSPVISDTPGRRDVLHSSLTNEKIMVRFVGHNLHASDAERVSLWMSRLKTWFEQGLKELYFFLHEPDEKFAPELVSLFVENFNRHGVLPGTQLRPWKSHRETNVAPQVSFF